LELDQSQAVTFVSTHFFSSMPFTSSSKLALQEEMAESYLQEKNNWVKAKAFNLVKIADVPVGANIISSHVVYKWKAEDSLKARIVPHGHRDDEKQFLRTDAPTMSVEILRLIVSIAVENNWKIGSLDVKAAYLQATGFNRKIYVRPPKEERDSNNVWRLEKPAYGLADSGRLWFLTAFRALESHGLNACPYDKTVFASKTALLFVTTQVDNFLFTGSDSEMKQFTDYMKAQFELSELEYDNFSVYGTVFSRDEHGIHMSQRKKIIELQQYPLSVERRRMHDEPVTRAERLFYMSTVGSILFIGHVTSPIAARMAGILASALPNLSVKDIKYMNTAVRRLYSGLPAIAELYFPTVQISENKPIWLTFSDASFSEDYSKNRAGVLVTRSFGLGEKSPMHVIDFCSHKLRRVARSTKTAETLPHQKATIGHIIAMLWQFG
jgi:Reverse transcriptase (RNA-dependent DNA polymerase)